MGPKREAWQERFVPLQDTEKLAHLLSSLRLLGEKEGQEQQEEEELEEQLVRQEFQEEQGAGEALACSTCQAKFDSLGEQRDHFKLDLHRYNLKQSLRGRPVLTEDQFEKIVGELEQDEDEEISGSDDSEEEEEEDRGVLRLRGDPRLLLLTADDRVVAVHKCLLPPDVSSSPSCLASSLQSLPQRCTWAVILLGGGHFAGAVFRQGQVWVHKTFHSYTVRAKQGGSQGAADGKSGSSQPKSAGASLRRYNELQLLQHIQDITQEWAEQLAACHLIFYRAAASNRTALFGGKSPALQRGDPRLRSIPFPTKRATFKEVKRVQEVLGRLEVLGSREEVQNKAEQGSPAKRRIHRSKSREEVVRELPGSEVAGLPSGEKEEGDGELGMEEVTVGTGHLQEFHTSVVRRKVKKSRKQEAQEGGEEEEESIVAARQEAGLLKQLLTAVTSGNSKLLADLVAGLGQEGSVAGLSQEDSVAGLSQEDSVAGLSQEDSVAGLDQWQEASQAQEGAILAGAGQREASVASLVNSQFGESRSSCLHIAAREGHKAVIASLLSLGADPTVKDRAKKVPYCLAKDKDTRNCFRKFMGEHPERYDYKTAQIPPPMDKAAEEEKEKKVNEKKKAQRAAKREKEKVAKVEEQKVQAVEEERQRFLHLTDREKRALAAERRLLTSGSVVRQQLCYLCGLDITGKTPFEYGDNKFCSVKCVKQHRAKNL